MSRIESTFKAREVEEAIDIWFYRPLGYFVARVCVPLGITPNAVTIISIFIGVAAGHLFASAMSGSTRGDRALGHCRYARQRRRSFAR